MRILRSYGDRLGYAQGFAIYDANDTKGAISSVMKNLNIDEKALPIKSVISEISRAKDSLLTPEDYELEYGIKDFRKKQIAKVYKAYQAHLKNSNALDFDDIIMKTVMLLKENASILESYRNKFRYVLIDEFQDTSRSQWENMRPLLFNSCAEGSDNLIIGDEKQCIYRFRNANPYIFKNKYDTYRDTDAGIKIDLVKNFRSRREVLANINEVFNLVMDDIIGGAEYHESHQMEPLIDEMKH